MPVRNAVLFIKKEKSKRGGTKSLEFIPFQELQ